MTVTAESLFRDYFLPLYPDDAKADLGAARSVDANPANNPHVTAHLEEAAEIFVKMAPSVLGTTSDVLALDFTDASVHRLSAAITREVRDRLMDIGTKATGDSLLFNVVVHGAAYVGTCAVKAHGASWAIRRPLWESLVRLHSHAGDADLPVFHWWLKSLADDVLGEDAKGATLADRYRAHVEVPRLAPKDLPIIAPTDRKLPKLAKVRYDAFYKYLRANLPELKDVGRDFPSPERFDELGFKSLNFLLVGGGRMLVVHGPTAHGLHAFWLTKNGFEKSAFWPCDAFPEPILRAGEGDKLEVVLSSDGDIRTFELLYWGP
ncbi:hypothetical protein AKJ09_03538 [Labilithrix luteola]|uniref:Uncharacterized protein n=1 Tax=Labilithrix luteola TaxID=1391654 RepID=A0A0K1PUR4_9BACT|nr:hypothetical protein [Labilithrix luteola]AKU96874.1 hypothetical protein AKJ09_03538 [Labilithrix luteola]